MRPVVVYIDANQVQLELFKNLCTLDCDLHLFTEPLKALVILAEIKPWVIISGCPDPTVFQMSPIVSASLLPDSVVMLALDNPGDMTLDHPDNKNAFVVDRNWTANSVQLCLSMAFRIYTKHVKFRKLMHDELMLQKEFYSLKRNLTKENENLSAVSARVERLLDEIESWVPRSVIEMVRENKSENLITRDIAGITFDIQNSRSIFGVTYKGRPLRNHIIQAFTEIVIKANGARESIAGDSVYCHFGILSPHPSPVDAAFASALEFRTFISNLSAEVETPIFIGISLHYTTNNPIHIHTTYYLKDGKRTAQKSYDTSSLFADLLHRIEKIVHVLPGVSIVMTKSFLDKLSTTPPGLIDIGSWQFDSEFVGLYVYPSKESTEGDLRRLRLLRDSTTKDSAA